MHNFNFRYLIAILAFGIGVLGVYLWFIKTASPNLSTTEVITEPIRTVFDNRPEVVVSSQPDSPIKITLDKNTEWALLTEHEGKKIYTFKASYSLENVSNKTIRIFSIRENQGEEIPFIAASSLFNADNNSGLFQPNQIRTSVTGGNFTDPDIPQRIIVGVDFVEFNDGSTWGEDATRTKESLSGSRAGAKVYLEYLQRVKRERGIHAVIKTVNQPITEALKVENALIPNSNQNGRWTLGFRDGMSKTKQRIKKAFESNGIKAAEAELEKPFDSTAAN
jgi:hypothetical protein